MKHLLQITKKNIEIYEESQEERNIKAYLLNLKIGELVDKFIMSFFKKTMKLPKTEKKLEMNKEIQQMHVIRKFYI